MAGVSRLERANPGRIAVDAFKAGNDVLTMPADLASSYQAVLQAVRTGEISQARLDESVLKILRAKGSLGLAENRLVDLAALPQRVGTPQNIAIGQKISDDSITLVRDNGRMLPITTWTSTRSPQHPKPNLLVVVLCDNLRAEDGQVLEREIRSRRPDVSVLYVDPTVASKRSNDLLRAVDRAQAVITAVYIVPSAARSMRIGRKAKHPASLPDSTSALFAKILTKAGGKTVVLAMGSPYLTDDFPGIQNYICTYSNATVSEISSAKALFGEIKIHGRMPVNLASERVSPASVNQPAQIVNMTATQ